MPKVNAWVDEYNSSIDVRIRDENVILIDIDGSEFECDPTDAREIGQTLIEMADQFDE